jgi:hypothetical protein
MNSDDLLAKLLGQRDSFEAAVADASIVNAVDIVVPFLIGLQASQLLENAERERRLKIVFSRTFPGNSHLIALGEAGAALSNSVLKNALTQLLPPDFRGLVFRRMGNLTPEAGVPQEKQTVTQPVEDKAESPTAESEGHADFSDVIILSISDDPATKKLLEGAGFTPLRCQTLEELDQMLATNEDICAFLVETSFLKSLVRDQQLKLIEKLACFSTFAWLRFQEDGLPMDEVEIGRVVARARCRPSGRAFTTELTIRDRSGLQEREIAVAKAVRNRLTSGGAQGLFTPGELNRLELKLLGAAMSDYTKERRFNPQAELTQVTTKFLQGGLSGARVALVTVNDFRAPVIVKLDEKDLILDEVRRFLTFIYKDNQELKPDVHFHGSAALIVFGIIPSIDGRGEQPAPTLESRLKDFWYGEMRSPARAAGDDLLVAGFKDAIRRLVLLNRQSCSTRDFTCKANPYLKSLKQMESEGFNWGFCQAKVERRDAAENTVKSAAEKAICHGDAHSRNVLIRGEEGFLIDYAYSGPGHPCCDLVKLESSIYYTKFIQFGTDAELINLQHDLSVERLSFDQLLRNFPGLLSSKTNQLALKLCVLARDSASEVLVAHNLTWEHYLAVKLLTAWQSLQVPTLQQSLVRGVIASLSV